MKVAQLNPIFEDVLLRVAFFAFEVVFLPVEVLFFFVVVDLRAIVETNICLVIKQSIPIDA